MEAGTESYDRAKSLLHELANTTRTIAAELVKAIEFLDPATSASGPPKNLNLASAVREPTRLLSDALSRFLLDIETELEDRHIPRPLYDGLARYNSELKFLVAKYTVYSHIQIYDIATNLMKICRALSRRGGAKYNREKFKELMARCLEIRRISVIYGMSNSAQILANIQDRIAQQLGRMQARRNQSPVAKLDLGALITRCKQNLEKRANVHKIAIDTADVPEGLALQHVDAEQMEKCVGQLLDNAIKYMGNLKSYDVYQTTWITIRARKENGCTQIEVESWGTPVTKEEYSEGLMFAEGYRGIFARQTSAEGTGIGLADLKAYVESVGGRVKYDTMPVDKAAKEIRPTKTTLIVSVPDRDP